MIHVSLEPQISKQYTPTNSNTKIAVAAHSQFEPLTDNVCWPAGGLICNASLDLGRIIVLTLCWGWL